MIRLINSQLLPICIYFYKSDINIMYKQFPQNDVVKYTILC